MRTFVTRSGLPGREARLWLRTVLCGFFLSATTSVFSLGLGELEPETYLGEPLRATLYLVAADEVDASNIRLTQLGEKEAQALGVDLLYSYYPLQFDLVINRGRVESIVVTTKKAVVEPYLNLLIKLQWPGGSVHREYNLLFDTRKADTAAAQFAPVRALDTKRSSSLSSNTSSNNSDYRVRPGDTLSGIAARVTLPNGMSKKDFVERVFDDNPQAFIGGDINQLIAGARLQLPGETSQLAKRTPAVTRKPAKEDHPSGKLSLSQPVSGGSTLTASEDRAALRAQIDGTQEMIDLLVRENEDLRERVERIESSEYLNTLTQLVAMQRKHIDELRQDIEMQARLQKSRNTDDQPALALGGVDGAFGGGGGSGVELPSSPAGGSELAAATFSQSLASNIWLFLALVIVGVSAVLAAAAAAFMFLRRPPKTQLHAQAREVLPEPQFEMKIEEGGEAEFEEAGARQSDRNYRSSVTSLDSRRGNRVRPLKDRLIGIEPDPKKLKKDEEVKERIRQKAEIYRNSDLGSQAPSRINGVEIDVLVGLDEEINELLSMAKIYCSAGKFSEARAILNAQQKIETDSRLIDALAQIDELEMEANQAS